MTNKEIKDTVIAIGFKQDSKNTEVFTKTYDKIKYDISVDLSKDKIDYGNLIKRGDETTSNLQHPENLVVLECVNRLIEKGYKPNDLTLEKKWKLGRTAKSGKADITVKGKDGKTLLIIECKTYGQEFTKELDNMKSNGGQLFSYFQQDKNTRYLCLYASRLNNKKIEKINALVKVEDKTEEKVQQQETEKIITYDNAKTIKEMLEVWKYKTKGKQTFLDKGLFEDEIEAYNPGYIPLRINDLKDFEKEDKGKVFNQFEEILRHNNISDRSNAFNRIISLILAKIVDENKGIDAITDFQLKEGIDDAETLLERLQSLYSKAMKDYLDENVIDYKLEDIEKEIDNFPRQTAKETLFKIYKELKFYQNNEFAFKEVYNKKLFEENAKVLEEVVRLFQNYRFKYEQKAQFLGDFFELILESGYKQTEGQFFTPTPIARFINSSIPLNAIVDEKLKRGEKQFLPVVIDFACGSGHFLTEAIEKITNLIANIDENDIQDEQSIHELRRYKEDMRWAGEYIYGIEKDYRLARTSQVACFMHGDGDANIIFGDGLEKHERMPKDGKFDVLIANPPYTIKDFKKHLKVNPHDFDLWEHVTPDSDDIEVFFIERMKQLLRPGGMAGIILPSSIISNAGVYTKAREIIIKHFEIKAIVEFGGNTFGATSTNTVTLFLKKRNENFVTNCQYIAEDFISENKSREGDFLNSEELFENYVAQLELDMDDYKTFIARNPNEAIKETEFYNSYKNWFDGLTEVVHLKKRKTFTVLSKEDKEQKLNSMFFDVVLEIETEKFFYFLLTHRQIVLNEENAPFEIEEIKKIDEDGNEIIKKIKHYKKKAVTQKVLIVKTGRTNKEQEKFLGYKFSNRRGYKGIDFTSDTLMFDLNDQLNPKKVNSYIYKNFMDEKIKVDEELAETLSLVRLKDCINFEKIDFDKRLNTNAKSKVEYETKYMTKSIGSLFEFQSGLWKGKKEPLREVKVLRNTEFLPFGKLNYQTTTIIPVEEKQLEARTLKKGDIILERSGGSETQNIGRVAYFDLDTAEMYSFGNFTSRLRPIDNKTMLPKYGMIFLNDLYEKGGTLMYQSGIRIKNLNQSGYKSAKIPVPPLDIQQKIITEIEAIEAKEAKAKKVIEENTQKIDDLFLTPAKNSFKKTLGEVCTLKAGQFVKAADIKDNPADNLYPCYGGNGLRGFTETFTHEGTYPLVGRQGALCGNVHLVKGKFHATEHALVATPKKDINVVWLYHLLRTMKLNQYARGVAQPGLSVKYLTPLTVNVLPIKQQEKVIKEIEKLEKEIQKQEQAIANTEEEKKAVLTKYLEK